MANGETGNKEKPQEQQRSQLKQDVLRCFLAGVSSIISGSATHPIDTCKIRMQIQQPLADGSKKYKNLIQGIYLIGKEEGLRRGIYKGIEASCMREASYSTLRLGLYEPIKRMLGQETGKP